MALPVLVLNIPNNVLVAGAQIFIEGVVGFYGALNGNSYTVLNVNGNYVAIQANVSGSYQRGGNVHLYVSSVSGPAYLNGTTVQVLVNGSQALTLNYNNGVTLPFPAWKVILGIPYHRKLQFLPLGGDGQTVNQGKKRKVYDIVLRVWKSLGGQVSTDGELFFPINYNAIENINRNTDDDVLFTGDLHAVGFESKVVDYCMPVLEDTSPFPFQLLAAIIRSEIMEEK